MEVWAVGTVRNERDLIGPNIRHHFREGIDRFLLIDDSSDDGTTQELDALAQRYPVEWRGHCGPFLQDDLLTALAREAFDRGATWVIPIDADEFWHSESWKLRDVLRQCEAAALRVEVVNFVQRRDRLVPGDDALLEMTWRTPTPMGPVEEIAQHVREGRCAFVEIAYPPKWIARSTADLRIGWGNHYLTGLTGPVTATDKIICLHAPLRSRHTLTKKADLDRPSLELNDYLERAWHLDRWREIARGHGLDTEWLANSQVGGALDLDGVARPLVPDARLRELVTNAADPVIWSSAWSPCRLASVTKQAIWRRAEAIDGWFGREEGETVMDLVASAAQVAGGYLRIVEIGSYHGRSTAVLGGTLLEAGIPGRVYAVDPHNGHVGASDGALGEERREPTLATFTNNLGWAIASDRLTIVRQRSETVDWRLPVDVLLLDGLHDYTSVRADLGRFAPHVRVGGLIIFHDRSVDFPAVEVWINRLLESRCYRMCAEIGSLVALQKISRASDPNPDLKALDPLAEASAINAVQAKALGTLRERVDSLTRERLALSTELIRTQSRVTDLLKSRTWRWTTPFRAIWARLRRL